MVNPPSLDVEPGTVLLVDGVFLQRPELDGARDLVVYAHASPAETLRRALQRDAVRFSSAEEVRKRYEHRYLPAQAHYRAVATPRNRAWVFIDNEHPAYPHIVAELATPGLCAVAHPALSRSFC